MIAYTLKPRLDGEIVEDPARHLFFTFDNGIITCQTAQFGRSHGVGQLVALWDLDIARAQHLEWDYTVISGVWAQSGSDREVKASLDKLIQRYMPDWWVVEQYQPDLT